jgi:ribosomal protein L1
MMPNPKNGTLIKSEKEAEKFSEDSVTIKTEKKQPVIHTIIGKVSFKKKDLAENAQAVLKEIPARQIVSAYLTSSMSPSVKLKV